MRYIWFIISIFLVIGCQNRSESKEKMNVKKKMIFNCLIYPTGNPTEAYLIELSNNGKMTTTFGTKTIEKEVFTKIIEVKTKVLSTFDLNTLLDLKNEIVKMKEMKRGQLRKGGWEIIFKTNEKKYHFYYGDMNNTSLTEIIKAIKQLSPVKIDLHGWS